MDYIVELEFDGPGFVAVPNGVVDDARLSAEALAVLVYLARLAGGRGPRIVRVAAICKRFDFGKDKWQRIARELRAVGALSDNFGRTDDGRNIVRSLVVGWPKPAQPVSRKTRRTGKTCEPENPAHTAENPAQVSRKTRLLKEQHTAARGGSQAAKPRAAGGSEVKSDRAAARFASSRGETSRAAGKRDGLASADGCEASSGSQSSSVAIAENKARAEAARSVAASLGLPVMNERGEWVRMVGHE